jgi:acid phosphatase type 7
MKLFAKLLVTLGGVAVAALGAGAGASEPPDDKTASDGHTNHFARAPYIQLATPSSMVVVWRVAGEIAPVLHFGQSPERLDRQVTATGIVTRVSFTTNKAELKALEEERPDLFRLPKLHRDSPAGLFQYEARITGLDPNTRYYYAVYDGERRLTEADPSYHFVTHPPKGEPRPARIWVVGDSGTGRWQQHDVHGSMLEWTAADKRPIDFYIHLGDMAYQRGRDVEFQTRFFEAYESTLRHVVCWPTMGNHEGGTSKGTNGTGPYYDAYVCPTRGEAGGVATGTEAFYSFDYGRIHFICLDSHDLDRRPTGLMARWLKLDLERTKADWLVAFFHHPPYTKGSHDSDREKQLIEMRTHIMPILEWGGVDLVLTGHSHIYERSMLIDGAYATPTVAEGVVLDDKEGDPRTGEPYRKSAGLHPNGGNIQIVAGHGGTTVSRKGTLPLMRKIIVEHGSVIIDVDGDTMRGTMVNKLGEVQDVFALVKRGEVVNQRLDNPWQPGAYKRPRSPGEDQGAEAPEDFFVAIPKFSEWSYLAGEHPGEGTKWTELKYDDLDWKRGEAPFGYSYKEARTVLDDMKGQYTVLYMRHEFEVEHADHIAELGLMVNYDDGFIAYLNGKEVRRVGVAKGNGKGAQQVKSHDATRHGYFPLKEFEKHLRDGTNVLAIEGHNSSLDSHDFLMDAYLLIED